MLLCVIGHTYQYEMENLCRTFFPAEKIKTVFDQNYENEDKIATTILNKKANII